MSELLIEFFSEEIPPNLQISARKQFYKFFSENLSQSNLKYKKFEIYSTPTRLVTCISEIPNKIKLLAGEIKGPKVGVPEKVLENFAKSKSVSLGDLYEKKTEKGNFYFIKIKSKEINSEDELIKCILKSISSISWKKSMKWSDYELNWGRPLRSILAIFGNKVLNFKYEHLETSNFTYIEENSSLNQKKVYNFSEYKNILKNYSIILDQTEREKIINDKISKICKKKSFKVSIDQNLLTEVSNLVDKPNILLAEFDKSYLKLPPEVIRSTLQTHQRYFTLVDHRDRISNEFVVVANKKDEKKVIKTGNERVVDARLSDASFFWEKDKSLNLIKQINKLKEITFYENLGTVFDKTQRLRKMAYFISDQLELKKEKVEIAASISKTDLVSGLVGEFPELQGIMGKYFASNQGFEEDVSRAVSEHYLPISISSPVPKKPISYGLSIIDKLDTLVGFFLINEKPTSSKDPFALRRSAIGLLRTVIENNLTISLRDLIDYLIRIYHEQGTKELNQNTHIELIKFFRDRMKNIFKEKKN